MRGLAWASVKAHPLRLLVTALSVVLGIAFVSGTFVLTDTVRTAFDQLFGSTSDRVDVAVRAVSAFDASSLGAGRPPVPAEVLPTIEAVPGVAALEPRYTGLAQLVDSDGQSIGGETAPTLGVAAPTVPELAEVDLKSGRFPETGNEVAIDAGSAEALGMSLGDRVGVSLNAPVRDFTIVGTVDVRGADGGSGATVTVFAPETARALYGGAGQVAVLAEKGIDHATLRNQVADAVGPDFEALTGEELDSEIASQVGEFLGFLTRGLLVFAGAALLVGAVIILNTFGITVAQRTRELALLQAVGADGRQVFRMVLTEAGAVGLFGSALGIAAGALVAAGLRTLLEVAGVPLPSAALVFAPRTILAGLALGPVVTVVAAVGPALRASRVAPVEALRAGASPADGSLPAVRLVSGMLLGLSGGAALLIAASGLAADNGPWVVGAGALSGGLAVVLLGPALMAPVTRLLGEPVSVARGLPGRLARDNATRNPRRTGATASALIIGLGLVCFVLIFISSLRASVETVIENRFLADYQVQATSAGGFPGDATDQLGTVPGVDTVSAATFSAAGVNGAARPLLAIDPETFPATFALDVTQGGLEGLVGEGVAVAEGLLADLNLGVGDTVPVTFVPGEPPQDLQIVASYEPVTLPGGEEAAQVLVSSDRYAQAVPSPPVTAAFVRLAEGTDAAALRPALEDALAEFPGALLVDASEIRAQVADQANQLLGLVFGLLLLSVLVALVGVVNILGLSVLERTRELGLLQAVGMTRGQVRQMVRLESVIIALLGGVLGLSLGTAFAWLVVRVLRDNGLEVFRMPVEQMAAAVVVAAFVGVLASVLPAWRASRIDVLRALQVD